MQKHELKTWRPEILDNGMRVRLCYEGSGVLLPLIDFRELTDIKDYNDKLLENANRQNENIKELLNKIKELREENHRLAELAETRNQDATPKYYGKNQRQGTGHCGDAEIVAMAVSGASLQEIKATRFTYNRKGGKRIFAKTKITNALSVSKPEDYARVQQLYRDYPTAFKGISEEQINDWFCKKYAKLNKRRAEA